MSERRKSFGFTMLEILVVVAIIGILSVIAIWNYYLSVQKARQKRTVSDIKTIATAWESRATETHAYNAAAATAFSWPSESLTPADLSLMLSPTYVRTMPFQDGWGRPFDYALNEPVGGSRAVTYAIRSRGRDGAVDADYNDPEPKDFDCDIVYSDGAFIVYPGTSMSEE
jgi:type II secretion system protein G